MHCGCVSISSGGIDAKAHRGIGLSPSAPASMFTWSHHVVCVNSETSSRTVVDYHKKNQKEIGARSEVEQEMQKLTEELNNSKENLEKLRTSAEESALEAEQGDKTK